MMLFLVFLNLEPSTVSTPSARTTKRVIKKKNEHLDIQIVIGVGNIKIKALKAKKRMAKPSEKAPKKSTLRAKKSSGSTPD